jgi:hypothetical protein
MQNYPSMFRLESFPRNAFNTLKLNFLSEFQSWSPTTLGLVFEGAAAVSAMMDEGHLVANPNTIEEEYLDELDSFTSDFIYEEVLKLAKEGSSNSSPFSMVSVSNSDEEELLINYDMYSPFDVQTDLDNPILYLLLFLGIYTFLGLGGEEEEGYVNEEELPPPSEEESFQWKAILIDVILTLQSHLNPEWLDMLNEMP